MPSLRVYVDGVALWAPRLPSWTLARPVLRGERVAPDLPAQRPAPALLAPTERRRAPDTVAIALEVAMRACQAAARDPATLPAVFASTYGDLAISDYLCATLAQTPTLISPTKFHNSVHNAAAGYWTIGTGCTAASTALSAFRATFAQGFLEAAMLACCENTPTLLVAYDIEACGPMASVVDSRGSFGAALVLAPQPGERCIAAIDCFLERSDAAPSRPRSELAALIDGHPLVESLALFEALAGDAARCVRQTAGPGLLLTLAVAPR